MAYLKRWTLPLLTMLLITGGAALPYTISYLQDSLTETRTESRSLAAVNLTLQKKQSLNEVLQLVANEFTMFTYNGPTNLSSAEALEAAKQALQRISNTVRPCPLAVEADVDIELGLFVQNDNSEVSALIWLFNFTNNLSVDDYFIMIDDNSGKMVRFIASNPNQIAENPNYQFAYSDSDLEENQKIIEVKVANYSDIRKKWQDFCQEYYGMEIINYEENADFNGGWPVWQCNFQFTTANSDAIYELPVSYLPDMIIFN